jgi:hypothetical protein
MKLLIFLLCLIPMVAFAEIQLNFKDGSNMCGNYAEKGKTYCRNISGGEICFKKSDIASVKTVDDCGDIDASGESTDYLKKHNLSQADWLAKKSAQDERGGYPEYREYKKKAVKSESGR